ncbi:MAG: cyclic nucleotide-binding domain-containing protein [Candidatus Riflebacteria bacterium]|nr:cyclic nucleotide-binding domain-containing protein [Candidatus Riflebacteria bacterium]
MNQILLFADLEEAELEKLREIAKEEYLPADFTIFREGDASDAFYVVESGSIKIVKEAPGKIHKVLAYLHEGEFFGEMGIMKGSPRSAAAITLERTSLLKFRKVPFIAFLDANPIIAMKIRSAMVRRYNDNVFAFAKPGR